MGFLNGKKILITGVLSNRSIAYGIAQVCHREGAELAFSYAGDHARDRIGKFAEEFGSDKIEALTGVRPTLIRCPFGEYDDHVISAIRSIGMEPIQWDVDSLDWKGISAGEITKRVTGKVTNGSIVLFHNAGEHTPEALPDILNYLLGEGYEIVPISKLLLTNEETYIDHTGRQCRSAET